MQFIDLAAQYEHLKSQIGKRIENVLAHGSYILGPEVEEFEKQLADYIGVKHVVSCGNGTDALQLALLALDVQPGDAIFCPTFTFFATAEVIAYAGATPVFVDSDASTFNISPQSLTEQIESTIEKTDLKPKAIIAVDLFGLPANYPEIEKIAKKYDLKLIEDAAQGFGGAIKGKRAGSFGDVATTSFFPAKPLGCYGDGGALMTNDDRIAELCRSYRVHGKGKDKYDNVRVGINSRLDTLQAAVLLEKLNVFPKELALRNQHAITYSEMLRDKYDTPYVPENYYSSWAQFTIKAANRESLMAKLASKGIPTAIYYATCMHQQTAFRYLGYEQGDFPVAEKLSMEVFSIPMHPYLDEVTIAKVVDALSEFKVL